MRDRVRVESRNTEPEAADIQVRYESRCMAREAAGFVSDLRPLPLNAIRGFVRQGGGRSTRDTRDFLVSSCSSVPVRSTQQLRPVRASVHCEYSYLHADRCTLNAVYCCWMSHVSPCHFGPVERRPGLPLSGNLALLTSIPVPATPPPGALLPMEISG